MLACLHAKKSPKVKFEWTEGMNVTFESLKKELKSPPVLSFQDFEKPFVVGKERQN